MVESYDHDVDDADYDDDNDAGDDECEMCTRGKEGTIEIANRGNWKEYKGEEIIMQIEISAIILFFSNFLKEVLSDPKICASVLCNR